MIKDEFGLFRFRSPLLAKFIIFVSFPPGTEMFYFPGSAHTVKLYVSLEREGFPHSEIFGYNGH